MTKVCKECGATIQGRADKQFCSGYCRSTYNNRRNDASTRLIRDINRTLIANRKILSELNPNGKAKVHRNKMLQSGFNFDYHTNTYTTKAGKTYTFCYEQGYLQLEEDFFALVVKEEYVS